MSFSHPLFDTQMHMLKFIQLDKKNNNIILCADAIFLQSRELNIWQIKYTLSQLFFLIICNLVDTNHFSQHIKFKSGTTEEKKNKNTLK